MSFNSFIDRNYLITNPLNPDYNVNSKKYQNVDWYHYKDYSLEKEPTYNFSIDYKPDQNTFHNSIVNEEKKEEK